MRRPSLSNSHRHLLLRNSGSHSLLHLMRICIRLWPASRFRHRSNSRPRQERQSLQPRRRSLIRACSRTTIRPRRLLISHTLRLRHLRRLRMSRRNRHHHRYRLRRLHLLRRTRSSSLQRHCHLKRSIPRSSIPRHILRRFHQPLCHRSTNSNMNMIMLDPCHTALPLRPRRVNRARCL